MTTGVNNTKAVVDIDEKILSAIFIETASSTFIMQVLSITILKMMMACVFSRKILIDFYGWLFNLYAI